MRKLLEKRSIQLVLGITVIVIWGFNMLQIVDMSKDSEETNKSTKIEFSKAFFTLPNFREYQYKGDYKDPFEIKLSKIKREPNIPKSKKSNKKTVRPPQLKLTGIIEGTALIQNNNQTVFFVGVGDTVEGARIESIVQDSVTLVFKQRTFSIKL